MGMITRGTSAVPGFLSACGQDGLRHLIQGAQNVLTQAGQPDKAEQIAKLFATILGNDKISVGIVEFNSNLARARLFDVQNVAKNTNAQRIEVEDAMAASTR